MKVHDLVEMHEFNFKNAFTVSQWVLDIAYILILVITHTTYFTFNLGLKKLNFLPVGVVCIWSDDEKFCLSLYALLRRLIIAEKLSYTAFHIKKD